MEHREQFSQFKWENLDGLKKLDLATKSVLDAVVDRQDVFQAAHDAQLKLTKTLHEDTMRNINETQLFLTIMVIFHSGLSASILIFLLGAGTIVRQTA